MRFSSSARGQAMVEFALVLPVLFLLVFGIVDFGRYYFTQTRVEAASEAVARTAALGGTVQGMNTVISTYLPNDTLDPTWSLNDVTTGSSADSGSSSLSDVNQGDTIKVTVYAPFEFMTPIKAFFPLFSGQVSSLTVMVVEQ